VKYFIDGGGHKGESVRLFRSQYPKAEEFSIISFEPNVSLHDDFKDLTDIEFHNEAIWIEDGTITFYNAGMWTISSSLHRENKYIVNKQIHVDVPCIDFSRWVRERFTPDDYVVLKLDIEGSEYEVLEKMINEGSIKLISKLYIEWHPALRRLSEDTQVVQDRLVARLAEHGLHGIFWHAATSNPVIADITAP